MATSADPAHRRSHTIRVDLSEQRRRCVLKPIIRGDTSKFDIECERVVEIGQLREGRIVACRRWREVIDRRDAAKQFQQIPME